MLELIEVQKVKQRNKKKINGNSKIVNFLKSLMSKDLIKRIVIVLLLIVMYDTSGKNLFSIYIIQIMREFLDPSFAVYCSLVFDFVKLLATLLSVFLVKAISRRVLLFTSGGISAALMAIISLLVILRSGYLNSILKRRILDSGDHNY